MTEGKSRLDWVDAAKGLSIILVVMMHSAYGVGETTGESGYLHYVVAWATPFRMPEFFLISGLFLSLVIGRDWAHFADRRVVHYLYFYALWAVLQIAVKVALGTGDLSGALLALGLAVVEPYGVLWFIYMLAVFSLAAKLLHTLRAPHWGVLALAALMQMSPIHTGSGVIDEFASYFVYFYGGYALAPVIFAIVERAERHAALAGLALLGYALANGALVFSSGFEMHSAGVEIGFAGLPGVRLALAFIGSVALCVFAALLMRLRWMDWLRWLGTRSIVVYLAFAIPMAATRVLLVKLDLLTDTGVLSTIVLAAAVVAPLVLFWLIQKTGWGRFLFERPDWAHLPGAPGSRAHPPKQPAVPAE